MTFQFVTIFPQLIETFMHSGVVGQALKKSYLEFGIINPREFTSDLHKTVDDRPFGGGDGMVMLAEPLAQSVNRAREEEPQTHVIFLSPQGRLWTDARARELAQRKPAHLTLVCGRYAGVDQRWVETYVDEEISVGDYVLSGGELGALIVADSVARFVPGVLGNELSSEEESFARELLLECPQFSRPRVFGDLPVPEFLLSGHHKQIAQRRNWVALLRTRALRPDLWAARPRDKRELEQALAWALTLTETELNSLGLKGRI